MTKNVSIIILHYTDKKLTMDCLNSIKELDKKNLKIEMIIINNNPQENLEDLKKRFSTFTFLETGENLGFAEGNNVGIRYALKNNADFVFLLNNDTLIDKNSLVRLIEAADLDIRNGILGPKIYFAPGFEFHKNRYKKNERGKVIWYAGGTMNWQDVIARHRGVDEVDRGQYEKIEETNFVSGCAMLIKKEVFEKIGLLDKNYFLYYEDNDLCQRAKKAGFKIIFVPQAIVWHKNASSSKSGSGLQDYYISRNRLLFGLKYVSLQTKIALIRESIKLLFIGRQWQKKGIKDFYLRKLGKGSYEAN